MSDMRPGAVILASLGLGLMVLTIFAPGAAGEKPGRFTMQPIDGGVLRLDTETGSMALCTKGSAGLTCEAVQDPRQADMDVERLATENRDLKAEIKRLEGLLAQARPDTRLPSERPGGAHRFELPSEEDVDKALSYMERMMKKFRDKLKDFDGGRGRGTDL
ncbi:MAG: hypothetical protein ACKVP7_26785 [Hyphomicrobiaceae bacterium]